MAYVIECHIVDPDTEKISAVVNFYGDTEEEAWEIYDAYHASGIDLKTAEKQDRLVIEEGEIPDDEFPELESELEEPE